VLYSLDEGTGAVAHPGDRDSDFLHFLPPATDKPMTPLYFFILPHSMDI